MIISQDQFAASEFALKASVEAIFENVETANVDSSIAVVLDCANIGFAYGITKFEIQGVVSAIKYFESFAHVDISAFIPSSYLRRKPMDGTRGNTKMETDDLTILTTLVSSGKVTVVPAGDDDDSYIISFAKLKNGFVVSNDLFADHIAKISSQTTKTVLSNWLRDHRCGYTFVSGQTFMINPDSKLSITIIDRSTIPTLESVGFVESSSSTMPTEEENSNPNPFGTTTESVVDSDFHMACSLLPWISSSIEIANSLACTHPQRYFEIKYLLLARAHAYLEMVRNC
jgi:hypothetical protein